MGATTEADIGPQTSHVRTEHELSPLASRRRDQQNKQNKRTLKTFTAPNQTRAIERDSTTAAQRKTEGTSFRRARLSSAFTAMQQPAGQHSRMCVPAFTRTLCSLQASQACYKINRRGKKRHDPKNNYSGVCTFARQLAPKTHPTSPNFLDTTLLSNATLQRPPAAGAHQSTRGS